MKTVNVNINGTHLTIGSLSSHSFKLSTGDILDPQDRDFANKFNVIRTEVEVRSQPVKVSEVKLSLDDEVLNLLREVSLNADLIIAPLILIDSLKQMGIRDQFPNLLVFNSTQETRRSSPDEKVVDMNNWSY